MLRVVKFDHNDSNERHNHNDGDNWHGYNGDDVNEYDGHNVNRYNGHNDDGNDRNGDDGHDVNGDDWNDGFGLLRKLGRRGQSLSDQRSIDAGGIVRMRRGWRRRNAVDGRWNVRNRSGDFTL